MELDQDLVMRAINDSKTKADPNTADVLMELARRSGFSPEKGGKVLTEVEHKDLRDLARIIQHLTLAVNNCGHWMDGLLTGNERIQVDNKGMAISHIKTVLPNIGITWHDLQTVPERQAQQAFYNLRSVVKSLRDQDHLLEQLALKDTEGGGLTGDDVTVQMEVTQTRAEDLKTIDEILEHLE